MSGVFRPGVLTSLMGASGAGKTTLMGETWVWFVLKGSGSSGGVHGTSSQTAGVDQMQCSDVDGVVRTLPLARLPRGTNRRAGRP